MSDSGEPASGPKKPVERPAGPRQAAGAGGSPAKPARPARPAQPVARPAAPPPTLPPARPAGIAAPMGPIVEDDRVIVPAPDSSVFLHKPDYQATRKPGAFRVGLKFRRTFIPILLTSGTILACLGGLHFVWNSDGDPMAGLPPWLVGVMFALALVLWILAAANMIAVKRMLR